MIKTRAIVLSKKDFHDYDALVSFYSLDFGKTTLIARGVKRSSAKLAGHLEPFNLVDLMIIKGRERDYVGSAISEISFLNIKENYQKILAAGHSLGFLQELTYPQQADFNIFLLVKDFLSFLDSLEDETKIDLACYFFKFKVLEFLGYDLSSIGNLDKESDVLNNFTKIRLEVLQLKNKISSLSLGDLGDFSISEKNKRELDIFIEIIKGIIF